MLLTSKILLFNALLTLTLADQQTLNDHDSYNPLTLEIDGLIKQLLEELHVPAISIAVIDKGRISAKGYGISNFPSTKATPETLYFTGSTTKAFTATAAGLLVQDNDNHPNLTWSSHLHDLLPEDFVLSQPYETTHTTLEDALSHRSGLPRHDLAYGWGNATLESTVQSLRHLPLTAEPRTRFQYCNLMFGTVGYLVESLVDSSLAKFLTEKIYKPLDMLDTFFTLSDVKSFLSANTDRHLARGYFYHPNGYYIPEPYIDISNIAGAGATMSSVNDYAKWINAWLTAASSAQSGTKTTSPITTDLLTSLYSPRTIVSGVIPPTPSDTHPFLSPATYALGWIGVQSYTLGLPGPPRRLSLHGGGLPGFGTELYMLLDEEWGVVTMGNTAGTSNVVGALITYALYKQRFGEPQESNLNVNVLMREAEPWLQNTESIREMYGIGTTSKKASEVEGVNAKHSKVHHDTTGSNPQASLQAASGVFTHPAYGTITVSVEDAVLRVIPSARTWPWDVLLTPNDDYKSTSSSNFFTAIIRFGSGATRDDPIEGFDPSCDGELCRFDTFWNVVEGGLAYFKPGRDTGSGIDRIGIELDGEMVLAVERDRSPDGWRKGMIWFERIA